MANWYRVVDPLSPLFGCDVKVGQMRTIHGESALWVPVLALRRVDIFVGDRPFQLVGNDESGLGLMIDAAQLSESTVQSDLFEAGTDRPFGLCVDESELTRPDGYTLRIARYEQAVQMALDDPMGVLVVSRTFGGGPVETGQSKAALELFANEEEAEAIIYILKQRD